MLFVKKEHLCFIHVKLQDAFISETGTTWGSWQYIGYKMETTNNVFTYAEENAPQNGTAELGSATAVWKATPKAGLKIARPRTLGA